MKLTISLLLVVGVAQANFKSGAVSTHEKFTYGKFRAHVKSPAKHGTVASFYTYWDGPGFYPGGWNEIDMNLVPSADQPISTNVIYGDGHVKTEDHALRGADNFNESNWHTYEIEWTPTYIAFNVDGREIRHLHDEDHEAIKFMHKAQSLRMNFWTPTFHAWGADLHAEDMPWYVLFDYVEAYHYN